MVEELRGFIPQVLRRMTFRCLEQMSVTAGLIDLA